MKQNFSNSPLDKAERRISIYTNKILLATKKMPDDDPNKSTILALCGQKGRSMNLLASDADARRELYEQIAKLMQEKRKHEPGLCFYHLTLFDDSGVTSDRSPVVDILALRAKADRALRRLALSGISVIEAHPLINYPQGGSGRSILFHVHAIAWAEKAIDVEAAEDYLINGGGWQNSLGAQPVKIQLVGPSDEDMVQLAAYIVKPPHSGKNRTPRPSNPERFRLQDTVKGYRPEFALRMMEIFSQIELLELVSSVDDGKTIRQELRRIMNAWHMRRPQSETLLPGDFDTWKFWYELRQHFGSKAYMPVRILSGACRMRPAKVAVPQPKRLKKRIVPPKLLLRKRRKGTGITQSSRP